MSDKELLIAAAKAAGIEVVTPTMLEYGKWNPLTDDGDALRLAVWLSLDVITNSHIRETHIYSSDGFISQKYENDQYAATRRAIVRAAAEIGKAMP